MRSMCPEVKGHLGSVLKAQLLGEFDITLSGVVCSKLTRNTSVRGLSLVKTSILNNGWLSQFAPSVIVTNGIPEGGLTADTAKNLQVRVLDGNHRVTVCKELFGQDHLLRFRVYRSFSNPADEMLIANALNDSTESVARRSVYDKVFFVNELLRALVASGIQSPTAPDMKAAYMRVGSTPPSDPTFRLWKKAVLGLSEEAFIALEIVAAQDGDGDVDASSITWAVLGHKIFLDARPIEQRCMVMHMSRFRSHHGRRFKAADLKDILEAAMLSKALLAFTRKVFGAETSWTEALAREVYRLAWEQVGAIENIVAPWVAERKADLKFIQGRLPEGTDLTKAQKEAVFALPMARIVQIAQKDPKQAEFYTCFQEEYENVKTSVNILELVQTPPPSPTSVDANGGNDNSGGPDVQSDPPDMEEPGGDDQTAKKQEVGEGAGIGGEEEKEEEEEEEEEDEEGGEGGGVDGDEVVSPKPKTSRTQGALGGKRNRSGRGKGTTLQLLPTPSAVGSEAVKASRCREENVALYDGTGLFTKTAGELGNDATIRQPAKLVVINIGNNLTAVDLIYHVRHHWLHPLGTIALFVPHPWAQHLHRLHEIVRRADMKVVAEDHLLCIQYGSSGGGRPTCGKQDHLRASHDMVMFLHAAQVEGSSSKSTGFTCNRRVTTEDVYGSSNSNSPCPSSSSAMNDVPYEGSKTDFPHKALMFMIQRFTNPGDTVACLSAEKNKCADVAISRGRQVEAFVSSPEALEELNTRVVSSFAPVFDNGFFKVSSVKEAIVGPDRLPAGLPGDITPHTVKSTLAKNSAELGSDKDADAALKTCIEMASISNYDVKEDSDGDMTLVTLPGREYPVGLSQLPVWGRLRICNSTAKAYQDLPEQHQSDDRVRLILAASNRQLKAMLTVGKEVICSPNAQLYLEVAPTCPMYYARRTPAAELSCMEISSNVPIDGSQEDVMSPWVSSKTVTELSLGCPLEGSITTPTKTSSADGVNGVVVHVYDGDFVLHGDNISNMDIPSGSGSSGGGWSASSEDDLPPRSSKRRRCTASYKGQAQDEESGSEYEQGEGEEEEEEEEEARGG